MLGEKQPNSLQDAMLKLLKRIFWASFSGLALGEKTMGDFITSTTRLRWKASLILAKYYGRAAAKHLVGYLPLLLFAISLGLFALAVVPSLRDQVRNSTLLSGATLNLEIEGTVSETSDTKGQSVTVPLAGVKVEAGGFRTETAANGEYRLKILSKAQQNVPVLFSHGGREAIRRVSFSAASRIARQDFAFRR
jgi:hypothetical protein